MLGSSGRSARGRLRDKRTYRKDAKQGDLCVSQFRQPKAAVLHLRLSYVTSRLFV